MAKKIKCKLDCGIDWPHVHLDGDRRRVQLAPEGKKVTPETAEKGAIKEYLEAIGACWYWNLAGMGVFPGIPDLTAIYRGQVYQIEAKAPNGRQSEAQRQFQLEWEARGGIYILGGIDEVMRRIKK
jgi:hypothetical protein